MAAKRENTTTQGTNGGAERIEKQKHEMGYLETLTGKKTKKNNGDEYGLAIVLTWSRKQLRVSLKMAGT